MQGIAGVTAAILAGGLGTRLRPVVADRPKVLAEIRGRPFLSYLLDRLDGAGIRVVVLCIGYLGDQVRARFGDSYRSLRLIYSQELSPLGTAGALRLALPLFNSDVVLIMNGDSVCTVDLRAVWAWHCVRNAEATMVLTHMSDSQGFGRVHLAADGRVLSFEEKGERGGAGWINAGIYLVARRLLETIPATGLVSLERDMFPAWTGQRFYGYQSGGPFLDIGTPEAYELAAHGVPQDAIT